MPGSSTQETKTNAQTSPWAPQAGALTTAFDNAQNAYGQASQAKAPTDFTAQMTPQQLAAFQQMISQGGNLSIPGSQASTAGSLQTAGAGGVQGALSGLSGYNPAASNNPQSLVDSANQFVAGQNIPDQVKNAMLGATQTARDVTMPGIEQNAAIGGNTNSTRTGIADGLVQRGLAEQSNSLSGALTGQAFNQGLTLAQQQAQNNNTNTLGALTAQGSLGNAAAGTGVNAGTSSVANQGALSQEAATGGAGLTQAQQDNLTNQSQQYQSQVQSPYAALQGLMGIIGTNNWGSSSTGDSTTTKTPSAWDVISGLMSAGGSAAKGAAGLGWSPFGK